MQVAGGEMRMPPRRLSSGLVAKIPHRGVFQHSPEPAQDTPLRKSWNEI
jgi:hypothetical protein